MHDDCFYRFVRLSKKIKLISLHKPIRRVAYFHDNVSPVSENKNYKFKNISEERMIRDAVSKFL
jgi:hypothetical protein